MSNENDALDKLLDDLDGDPSLKNVARTLKWVARHHLTEEDVRDLVVEEHDKKCALCPARLSTAVPGSSIPQPFSTTSAGAQNASPAPLLSRLLSPTTLLFVIAVFSLFTAIYVIAGREGFGVVTGAATQVISPVTKESAK